MSQRHPIQNDAIMLVTTNTLHRAPVFLDDPYANEAVEYLYRIQSLHPFSLYGFVIMPDHCHFLLNIPPLERISAIIGSYKSGLTFDTGIPVLWQPRFHLRIPKDPRRALHYIHQNPVRAEYVQRAEDFPWSSANDRWEVDVLP